MLKKSIAWLLTLALCMSIFAGCGNKDVATDVPVDNTVTDDSVVTPTDDTDSDTLIITTAGNVTPEAGVKNVVIEADGVILENADLASVTLSPKLGDGTATLKNVKVQILNANGGGMHSLILDGTEIVKLLADRKEGKLHILVKVGSLVKEFVLDSEVLVDIEGSVDKFVLNDGATDSEVNIFANSHVKEMLIKALAKIKIDAEVDSVSVTGDAKGSEIEITKDGKIEKLKTDVPVNTSGEGAIDELVTDDPDNLNGSVKPGKTTLDGNDKKPSGGKTNPGKKPATSATPTAAPTATPTQTPSKPGPDPVVPPADKLDVTGMDIAKDGKTITLTFDEAINGSVGLIARHYAITGTNTSAAVQGMPESVAVNGNVAILTLKTGIVSQAEQSSVTVTVSEIKNATDTKVLGVNSATRQVSGNGTALTSTVLSVNTTAKTITAGTMALTTDTTVNELLAALKAPTGATMAVGTKKGTEKLVGTDKVKVTAQNGTTTADYAITLAAAKTATSVTFAKTVAQTVVFGDTLTNVATGTDGVAGAIAYSSDNTAAATVSDKGVITTVGIGTATITATFTPTADTHMTSTASYKVNVARQDLKAATVGALTYTGFPLTAVYTVKDKADKTVDAKNYNVDEPTIKNAATYSVPITGIGNYQGTISAEFTVAKADITVATATVQAKPYDNSANAVISDVTFTGLMGTEKLAQTTDFIVSKATYADANVGADKAVTLTVTLNDTAIAKNYNLTNGTDFATKGEITAIAVTNTAKADKASVDYAAAGIDLSTLFNIDTNAGDATYTATAAAANGGTVTAVTGKILTISKCGDFTIKMTTAAKGNYAAGTAVTVTLTVKKAANGVAPTGFTVTNATSAADNGEIIGTTALMEYRLSTDTNYTTCKADKTTALAAGTYFVRTAATDLQEASKESAAIKIEKLSNNTVITAKSDDFKVTANDVTANIKAIDVATTTVSEITAGLNAPTGTLAAGRMLYTDSKATCTDKASFERMNGKIGTVKYATGDLIWVLSEDGTAVKKYTITAGTAKIKATIEFKNPITTATFGTDATVTNAATPKDMVGGGFHPTYTYTSSNTNVVSTITDKGVATIVGAGETTITATAVSGGFADAKATYTLIVSPKTIAPAGLTVKTAATLTYTGTEQPLTLTFKDGETELKETDIASVTYTDHTNAGKVTATVTIQGNYTSVAPIVVADVATIGKATLTLAEVAEAETGKIYTGADYTYDVSKLFTLTGMVNGELAATVAPITYSLTAGTTGAEVDSTAKTLGKLARIGEFSITATVEPNGNYTLTPATLATKVTIAKGTAPIAPTALEFTSVEHADTVGSTVIGGTIGSTAAITDYEYKLNSSEALNTNWTGAVTFTAASQAIACDANTYIHIHKKANADLYEAGIDLPVLLVKKAASKTTATVTSVTGTVGSADIVYTLNEGLFSAAATTVGNWTLSGAGAEACGVITKVAVDVTNKIATITVTTAPTATTQVIEVAPKAEALTDAFTAPAATKVVVAKKAFTPANVPVFADPAGTGNDAKFCVKSEAGTDVGTTKLTFSVTSGTATNALAALEFTTAENKAAADGAGQQWTAVNANGVNDKVAATADHGIFVRVKATDTTEASGSVEATGKKVVVKAALLPAGLTDKSEVITAACSATGTVDLSQFFNCTSTGTKTYTAVATTAEGGAGAGTVGTLADGTLTVTKVGKFDISLATAANATYEAGTAVTKTITVTLGTAPAAPTGLGKTDATSTGGTDGTITGTTTAMEYMLTGGSTYTDCTDTAVTGLKTGTYLVRIKATAFLNAGADATVTVGEVDTVLKTVVVDPKTVTITNDASTVTATPKNAAGNAITKGTAVTYKWTIAAKNGETKLPTLTDDTKATVKIGGFTEATAGTYTLTVTATQAGGTTSTDTCTVTKGA